MIWTVVEEQLHDKDIRKHAGGKAREDLSTIFTECNFQSIKIVMSQIERENVGLIQKIRYHIEIAKEWERALGKIKDGDTLVLQFPVMNHSLFLDGPLKVLKKRGVRIIAFIHDLEYLRQSNEAQWNAKMRWRMKREELVVLNLFDIIVVHNDKMRQVMVDDIGIDEKKIVVLGIFDYLIDKDFRPSDEIGDYKSIIIAGNLHRQKSSFIYNLPKQPAFELYGVNFEGSDNQNVNYHGSFLANDLPFHLKGGFGLVWDGDSPDTCCGVFGEYLRYNNPHKTSLYLACGIPVIIWEKAALAEFILDYKLGFTVSSLKEIDNALSRLTEEEYVSIKKNAVDFSYKLRSGHFTKQAIEQSLTKCR